MGNTLFQYQGINAIFENSPIEGTTAKERTLYVNEVRRDDYPTIMTLPFTPPDRPVFFSKEDSFPMRFLHNDALIMMVHIGYYKISKILMHGGVTSIFLIATL